MKTKGCISILGLVGHTKKEQYIKDNKIKSRFIEKNEDDKAIYYFTDELKDKLPNLKNEKYFNMLPLVIENFKDYTHSCIYTETSKVIQQNLLKYGKIEFNIEDNGLFISENIGDKEAEYTYFLDALNKLMEDYDSVIVDMTHGFRHFPILAIINMIVQNIKHPEKIEHILFAKEIKQHKEYEIIDLQEYLDLASLSFIISNFKDNYTVSKHIKIKKDKYKRLIEAMNKFSSDIMSLSLENLLDKSSKKLTKTINDILQYEDVVLKLELNELKKHIDTTFIKKEHRFLTYYNLAQELSSFEEDKQKGYLVHSLALIYEAIGFYLKSAYSTFSNELKSFIEEENKMQKNKKINYYHLTDACRSFLFFNKDKNTNKFFSVERMQMIYTKLNQAQNIEDFKKFTKRVKKLRNNLLHANSGNQLTNTNNDIEGILQDFKKYCIDEDILNVVSEKSKTHSKCSNVNAKLKTMTNGEKRVVKNFNKQKIVQAKEDKKFLQESSNKLSGFFSNK